MTNIMDLPLELAQKITANLPIRDNYRYRMTCRYARSHCYIGQAESRIWDKIVESWWLDKMVKLGFIPTLIGMSLGWLDAATDEEPSPHENPLIALVLVGAGRYRVDREEFLSAILSNDYQESQAKVMEVSFTGFTVFTGSLFHWPCDVDPERLLARDIDKTLVMSYEGRSSDIYYVPVTYQEHTAVRDEYAITVQLLEVRHRQRHICRLWGTYTRRSTAVPVRQVSQLPVVCARPVSAVMGTLGSP